MARDHDKPVLVKLARCLALFPNLHTVKLRMLIVDKQAQSTLRTLEKAFGKYSYPQVFTAIISKWAYPFLNSCPNLRSLRWLEPSRYSPLFWRLRSGVVNILQSCRHVRNLALRAEDGEWLEGKILLASSQDATNQIVIPQIL